jgi:DNA-binding IclR family transcriptional regulator
VSRLRHGGDAAHVEAAGRRPAISTLPASCSSPIQDRWAGSASSIVISGQEVAEQLGVARSTAYRYLQSLTSSGFIEEQRPSGSRLGPRVFELARLARKGIGLSEAALPLMRRLVAEVGETVLLTRRTGTAVVCLERESTDRPARLSYERGHILPVNADASAMVLLAWAPPEEVERVIRLSGLPRLTGATVTDPAALLTSAVRRRGPCPGR